MHIEWRTVSRILILVVLNAECSRSETRQNGTSFRTIAPRRTPISTTNTTTTTQPGGNATTSINGGHKEFTWLQKSSLASDIPSSAPSAGPTVIASRSPSLPLSQTPSISFTALSPSMIPSISPSWLPSISPTPTCHDNPTYMSPLNDFQCHDHAGTNCFRWRFLGLTADEVKELVESCPITCKVQCGELVTMLHRITFILRNMENFLSPESTLQLQTTMIDYLNDFVQPKVFENSFLVIAAELTSQQILTERRHHHQFIRHLTAAATTTTAPQGALELQVTMELRAFAVNLDYDIIDALLIEGIENLGLGLALRLTNDEAFRGAETSMTRYPTPVPPSEPRHTVMEPLAEDVGGTNQSLMWLLGLTLALLVGVTVYSTILVTRKRRRFERRHKRESSDMSAANHPLAHQTSAVQVLLGNATTSAFGQVLSFETIVRVMSSCSPSSNRSRAKRKVHEVDEDSAFSGDDTHTGGSNSSGTGSAPQNVDEHSAVHPLTGIIPPMIVYDGFDGDETFKTKSVVPSRKLHAPPTFLEALLRQEGNTLMDSSLYDGIISYDGSDSSEDMEIQETASDSESESLNENSFPTQFPNVPPKPPSANATTEARCRSPLRSLAGAKVHPGASLPLPRIDRASSTGSWESFRQDNVGAKLASPEKRSINGFAAQSMVSLSPRKKWKIPFSLNALETAPQLPQCPDEDGQQLIFHAPRKGKLGLVIQCIDLKGPVVTTVKTYSPLLGLILPGDRILDIDGTTTTGMTLKDVTGIMGGKIAAQSNRRVTVFHIVVFRPVPTKKDEILGLLNENPESSALLLSDSPYLEHAHHQDPTVKRRNSFGEAMRIS